MLRARQVELGTLCLFAIVATSCSADTLPIFAIGGTLLKDLSTRFPEPDVHPSVGNAGAVDYVVDRLQREFWNWYVAHKNDVIVQKRILWAKLKLTVRDLRPLFVRVFGEPPADVQGAS